MNNKNSNFFSCPTLTDASLEDLGVALNSSLSQLQTLKIYLSKYCSVLMGKSEKFSRCEFITDFGLKAFSKEFQGQQSNLQDLTVYLAR